MDDPDVASSKVHQFSEDEELLSKETQDEDSIVVVEVTGQTVPGLSQRNKNHKVSLMPSNRFCKIKAKAKYMERQPLISKAIYGHDVPQHFNRSGLHPEKPQFAQLKTECSNSTELLRGLQDLPVGLPIRAMDSKLYSPVPKSLHTLDTDCNTSQTSFSPYSSTPNRLSSNRAPHFSAVVSCFSKTGGSLQPPKDTGFEQQNITRSKRFLTPGASTTWYLPSSSNPEENSLLSTHKLIPVDNHSLVRQGRKMSPFQADYWACAIPDSLPPSPDRQSPHWNPDKEYEDLLDYTYPLRPKYKLAKNSKDVHDSSVHDSGIDLDNLSISPENTLKSMHMQGQEHSAAGVQNTTKLSVPLLKMPECSAPVSLRRPSPVGKVSVADGMSGEMMQSLSPRNTGSGLSDSTSIGERGWDTKEHDTVRKNSASSSFIRSTRVLPLPQGCSSDEEYLSLPPRLKELETLAQQLTDLSLTLRKPGCGHMQDGCPCISVNGEPFLPEVYGDCSGNESLWEKHYGSSLVRSSQENRAEDLLSNQGFRDHGSTQKETASTDTLETQCLEFLENESHHVIQEKDYYRDSLAQCIKTFCCQLEELICWLHKVAEVTDNWIPPKPDIENVKASLQSYLAFRKDLAGHQALTGSVLQNGERLLKCMASNSPILQNTLSLIAKQSEELESHAERLYESVLAAMDSLGTSSKNCDAQTAAQMESSNWVKPIDVEFVSHSLEE